MTNKGKPQDLCDYSDPKNVLCLFSYEELDEISESLKFTWSNDPDADKEFNEGLNKHVRKIMKRVRSKNPSLAIDFQNSL